MAADRVILALALTGVLAAQACGGSAEPSEATPQISATAVTVDADLIADGRRSYRKYCAQCHGYYGKGDGTSAAHLDPPPRDHTDATVMNQIADAVIAQTIRFGGAGRGFPGMPAFPKIPPQEVVSLVAYVRSLSRPDVRVIETGELR